MIRRDMPDVLQIEEESFEYAWTEEDFLRCLRQRNCIGMCADSNDKMCAFMIYELFKTRIQILNFAVHPAYRRRGIGQQMVSRLYSKLSNHRRNRITLVVRESNLTAQLFFRSLSFSATKVLRKYYQDSGEDAYYMQHRLTPDMDDALEQALSRIAQFEGI
jgi:ribosomal-protein-alanine N-acetyltransferase